MSLWDREVQQGLREFERDMSDADADGGQSERDGEWGDWWDAVAGWIHGDG